MATEPPQAPESIRNALHSGLVIPAHPLALTPGRALDERRQVALTRYYHAAAAGGLAVGVHTTQFAIRNPGVDLLRPVLELAATTTRACDARTRRETVLIAGVCGETAQAVREAQLARELGYHAGLLSLAALKNASIEVLLEHCREVSKVIPLFGFYLQPSVGGRLLPHAFWRALVEIPNLIGIKVAPFNRYQTLDVLRAVAESGRHTEIALYTGNDDQIVSDLVTPFRFSSEAGPTLGFAGGLLGHWAFGTRAAVGLLARCKQARASGQIPTGLLAEGTRITELNAAVFDSANAFHGCIPGIHEMLRRDGLLEARTCLNPGEELSSGQLAAIERVSTANPDLLDSAFIREHLDRWLE